MYGELSCSAINCVHNLSGLCSAINIHVIGSGAHSSAETMCNTFSEKGIRNAFTHLTNINIGGEIKQLFTNSSIEMSPIIKCDAFNCKYNENRDCTARNIQVHGPDANSTEGTQCVTFNPSY